MMGKTTGTVPPRAALGILLLLMSGGLLAVDIGATRALQIDDGSARLPADPEHSDSALSSPPAAPAPSRAPAVAAAAAVPRKTAPTPATTARQHTTVAQTGPVAPTVTPRVAVANAVTQSAIKPNVGGLLRAPQTAGHGAVAMQTAEHLPSEQGRVRRPLRVTKLASPHRTRRSAETHTANAQARTQNAASPIIAASHVTDSHIVKTTATGAAGKPPRTTVEAAQYFVLHMVKAQTPGLRLISAVTTKRTRDRLVVRVIAHTGAGTLVESDFVRRNGIGFALESRKNRWIAAVATPANVAPDAGP